MSEITDDQPQRLLGDDGDYENSDEIREAIREAGGDELRTLAYRLLGELDDVYGRLAVAYDRLLDERPQPATTGEISVDGADRQEPDWAEMADRLSSLRFQVRQEQPLIPFRDVCAEALRRLMLDGSGELERQATAGQLSGSTGEDGA